MEKPTLKPGYILLIILLSLFIALVARSLVFRGTGPEKVTDTAIRARLLKERQNKGLAHFLGSASNERYSSIIYDIRVRRPGKGPLPWASSIEAGPSGKFEFTWRVKVDFNALFSINQSGGDDSDLYVKLTSAEGLPLYTKTMGFSIPDHSVALPPGIYALNVSSNQPLTTLEMSLAPASPPATGPRADAPVGSLREINLKLGLRSMKDFKRLVSFGSKSTDKTIVKMPGARVGGELFFNSKRIGAAQVGLSGRSRWHLEWFPSIDIKISGGRSIMGIPSFKLYRLGTKTGILEFTVMSILQDMGFFMPRHDLIHLMVNGESQGVYLLLETTTPALFSNARRLEGDIVGTELDKLFFDYPYGADLESRFFFKARGTGYERLGKGDLFSSGFAEKVNRHALAGYIAFAGVYLSGHGLGVDDLRFYMDPASGLFSPLPRDLNPAFLGENLYRHLFLHMGWLTGEPPYTVWPTKRLYKGDYTYERSKGVFGVTPESTTLIFTDIHPTVINFISKSKNLALVNRYVRFFLDNDALRKKMLGRAINASNKVLSVQDNNDLITQQNNDLTRSGLSNIIAIKDYLSFMWDEAPALKLDDKSFLWNRRTSQDLDHTLAPALFGPLDLSGNKKKYAHDMSTALSVETQIFKILDKSNMTSIKRSFRALGKKEALYPLQNSGQRKGISSPLDKIRAKEVINNVATYVMTRTVNNERGIVVFLVRNETGESEDYSITTRKGITEKEPVINKVFYAAGLKGNNKATTDDIFKNRFIEGERLRLLVFDIALAGKPVFYRLNVPKNASFIFPPYMYLPSKPSGKMSERALAAGTPEWAEEGIDGLHVRAGSLIKIDKTVTIDPGAGKALFIQEGVRFSMGPGAGLIVKGDLHIEGTKERPIKFLSRTARPWGGLYSGREKMPVEVSVKHAVFDNFGAFPKTSLGGLKLNGGLTMLGANLRMDNVQILNARSEDALNLIHSRAELRNIRIVESFADSIDLDFTDAKIHNLTIEGSNGDGLDISNSLVLCLDSVFNGSADKAISVGEMSHIVVKNSRFVGNITGIANKDQSFIRVNGSTFEKNGTAVSEFIKKPWFGKPEKSLKDNTYRGNKKRYDWRGFYTY
ncbi:MAG: right-handed parallel beta-helix repeat-containing protein [Thermodesulfobacteriota bacterium]